MASRLHRQLRITELLAARAVRNQQDLQSLLSNEGIAVTQATLSRDLRALHVVKGPAGYRLADDPSESENGTDTLDRALRHDLLKVESGGNLLVLRTLPGHANALAVKLDGVGLQDVLGTVAGDDTVFLAIRTPRKAADLARRFQSIAGHVRERVT